MGHLGKYRRENSLPTPCALKKYRRSHGFESLKTDIFYQALIHGFEYGSGLNCFQFLISQLLKLQLFLHIFLRRLNYELLENEQLTPLVPSVTKKLRQKFPLFGYQIRNEYSPTSIVNRMKAKDIKN